MKCQNVQREGKQISAVRAPGSPIVSHIQIKKKKKKNQKKKKNLN